jgi:DNA-binding NarL/FixJ family response regulator
MAGARTIVVDDHPLFRLGLVTLFGQATNVVTVGEASTASEGLQLAASVGFEVALIDLVMPGDNGIALAAQLRAMHPTCNILGLSMIDDPAKIAEMLLAGADGYVLKSQPIEELIVAIETVRSGQRYLPPRVSAEHVDWLVASPKGPFERLTAREREICEHLVRGETNLEIATSLYISERTVETHRQRILKKLGAHSIVQVIAIAVRSGFDVKRD